MDINKYKRINFKFNNRVWEKLIYIYLNFFCKERRSWLKFSSVQEWESNLKEAIEILGFFFNLIKSETNAGRKISSSTVSTIASPSGSLEARVEVEGVGRLFSPS